MSTLSEFIKRHPGKTRAEWAEIFGISRPYLYSLIDGSRFPSAHVARRIYDETNGQVPICSWPNLSAILAMTATPTIQPPATKRKRGGRG